ncbi:MAG: penicillin-insensitive murein endopeptidase [Pseudomonadota bacterium]
MTAISTIAATAQTPAKEIFGRTDLPSVTTPEVHGYYTKGCLAGGVAMPTDGQNWQAMRLERNRRWGHPQMIALLQRLSTDAAQDGWPGLLVGDISQPRGGPMLTGHRSHQVGLDADVWLTKMPNRRLSRQERRDMSAISVLQSGKLTVNENIWTREHGRLLRRAALYNSVERVLVHPGIKKKMCETYGGDSSNNRWMIKLRPVYGHHYHFHIRIKCPEGSPGCRAQNPVPASGNGCDETLDWWFTSEPWTPRKPDPKKKTPPPRPRITTVADLPPACRVVLEQPQPANEELVTLTSSFSRTAALASSVPSTAPLGGRPRTTIPRSKLPVPALRPVAD